MSLLINVTRRRNRNDDRHFQIRVSVDIEEILDGVQEEYENEDFSEESNTIIYPQHGDGTFDTENGVELRVINEILTVGIAQQTDREHNEPPEREFQDFHGFFYAAFVILILVMIAVYMNYYFFDEDVEEEEYWDEYLEIYVRQADNCINN